MILKLLEKIVGDPKKKDLKRLSGIVFKINEIEERYQRELSDEDIPKKTAEFKERIAAGESTTQLLPEAFALVKNAARRLVGKTWQVRGHDYTWDMIPYDVQMIGGIVLHEGRISEMKTGEGKTLVSTFPIYLNALEGKGVHVVTVNDYLAQRDAEWNGGLFRFLGLSVGISLHGQNPNEKRAAYNADITYGTNNEFGFDYLRDNMAQSVADLTQRALHYAIIDEVDSILIDEARTPLIISAPAEESTDKYMLYSRLVKNLEENVHFNIDEKQKVATLSEEGIKKMEELLGVANIYTDKGFNEVHHIEQALRAQAVYKKDVDYVIKDGEILIVDEFTGRLMAGRRFGQGLHQAIEAKEGVEIKRESKTLATVTLQNYFRLYKKIAGMTGTAITEEEEFISIYGLSVLEIPTNKTIARADKPDAIYKNIKSKFIAIAEKTREMHEKGQPVLIGTISVEKSEALSKLLEAKGIKHNVLNAKFHEKEAEIVASAGQRGAVTIATNMAGRGTDIKLGEGVKELGGLCVIGSERHEARRIDNQLRGRSGRQGDPGMTQFYVSMDDDLMRIFGGAKMQSLMERLGLPDDMPIENRMISGSIESAQKKVEGHNFDIRKHLVEYDDVMNKHREIIYRKRRDVLEKENLKNEVLLLIDEQVEAMVLQNIGNEKETWESVMALHRDPVYPLAFETLTGKSADELTDILKKYLEAEYEEKAKSLPDPVIMRRAERSVMLRVIDRLWMEHIDELRYLREAVALSGYGQRDPLIEYKNQAYLMFEALMRKIDYETLATLMRVKINVQIVQPAPKPEMETNEDKVMSNIEGETGGEPKVAKSEGKSKAKSKTGPNEPCPCGSGKKYKKCSHERSE